MYLLDKEAKYMKRLMGRFMSWCNDNSDSIIVVLSIVAGVIGGFLFYDGIFNNDAFNTMLLIMISTNLLLIIHRYLKRFDTRTKNLEVVNEKTEAVSTFFSLEWNKILDNARHDVFISSAALFNMTNGSEEIKQWVNNKNHILRLVSLDSSMYSKYLEVHHTRRQVTKEAFNLTHYKEMALQFFEEMITTSHNVVEKEVCRVMQCAFIAIDCGIDTPSFDIKKHSRITAFFYFPNKLAKELVMKVTAVSGTVLFDAFKEEIEAIWLEAIETDRSKQVPNEE
jgi:hypothetical protein